MAEKQQDEEERVVIFLDGSNFYHRLKDSGSGFKQLLVFDYKAFAKC